MITAEQLNALKPSWEKPVIMLDENADYVHIISPVINSEFVGYLPEDTEDYNSGFYTIDEYELEEYTFPEKPKKSLYHFIYKNVSGEWCPGFTLVTKDGLRQDGRPLDYKEWKILDCNEVEVDQ